jgi:hypothetical protein
MTKADGPEEERLTTVEATSRLCWHLWHGEGMSTAQAAELIGYTERGARGMLCKISVFWPIYQDDEGVWQLLWLNEPRE